MKNQSSGNNYSQLLEDSPNFLTINSFIGSEIGDPYSELAENAPRSAKHVVTLSWSWSPMHSRTAEYRIASDKNREAWHLYEINPGDMDGKKLCSRISSGSPYKGMPAERAAYLLLQIAWKSEVEQWDFNPSGFEIDESGLLTNQEIFKITEDIEWSSKASWFREQSPQSIDVLKELISEPIDDQLIDFFDEIETSATYLNLPLDFLELCKYYELERPSLLSLACFIVNDASVVMTQKLILALANVDRFRKEIDLMVSELDDSPRRGGGTTLPSIRSTTKSFIEQYVGEHGDLPIGTHETSDFFKSKYNFDELRRKYSL